MAMDNWTSYSILIVDDNHNNLYTLKELIESCINSEVIEADCGEKALHILYKQSVDLIVLDIQMEGMDGFELATLIKQRKKTRDIPIVFLTAAYTNEEFKKRGFEIGAVDYLTKPIDEYQLINRINVYLKMIEKERNLNLFLEQKVNEQTAELRKAKEAAEAANEAKTMFFANISHELRTPLNIMLSSTQLMKYYIKNEEKLDKDRITEKLNIQTQNCYRLLRLVNNIIDITKIDSGHFSLSFTTCNIVEIIENVTLSIAEYVQLKGIELVFDTDIEEKLIRCDLDAIERIMLNLLSNAIKFTPKGGSILVTIHDMQDYVRISVKDTGVGIQKEMQSEIFERFKQVDNLLTRRHEGSGIGLSLVKSLVEMHGGKVSVQSEYQAGSEFIVEIPCLGGSASEWQCEKQVSADGDNVIKKIDIEFSDIYF